MNIVQTRRLQGIDWDEVAKKWCSCDDPEELHSSIFMVEHSHSESRYCVNGSSIHIPPYTYCLVCKEDDVKYDHYHCRTCLKLTQVG